MMEKAGYFRRTGYRAFDREGLPHEIIELHILGEKYAIRFAGLAAAISGRIFVSVEALGYHWEYLLGGTAGLAQVSASGKALNIELFGVGSFTVSLRALRSVMYGKERQSVVVKIPASSYPPAGKTGRMGGGQQQICAAV